MPNVNVLVKEEKYIGKYVGLRDFSNNEVCGSGDTLEEAYQQAVLTLSYYTFPQKI